MIVSTPHHFHAEPTLAAVERGFHVFVQKPMALTSKDAWAVLKAVEWADRSDRALGGLGDPGAVHLTT